VLGVTDLPFFFELFSDVFPPNVRRSRAALVCREPVLSGRPSCSVTRFVSWRSFLPFHGLEIILFHLLLLWLSYSTSLLPDPVLLFMRDENLGVLPGDGGSHFSQGPISDFLKIRLL